MDTRALVSGRINKRGSAGKSTAVVMRGVEHVAATFTIDIDTSVRGALDDAALRLIERDRSYDENGELV